MRLLPVLVVVGALGGAVMAHAQAPDVAVLVDLNRLPNHGQVRTEPVSAAPSPAEAATLSQLAARAVACIERNATVVEAAEANLSSAVTLLVNDLCAREATARETYKRSAAMLRMMKQMPAAYSVDSDADGAPSVTPSQRAAVKKAAEQRLRMYKNARVDPETGEIVGLGADSPFAGGWAMVNSAADAPPDLRALAAERLIAARRARLGR